MSKELNCALSGAIAGSLQTGSLIWLRTINKHQYYYGYSIIQSYKTLYNEGSIFRFFRGTFPAVIDNGLCRFGDAFIYSYVKNNFSNYNIINQSLTISILSTPHKLFLTPLDTIANNYHIFGDKGKTIIKKKINDNGLKILYNGGSSIMVLNIFSSYIWFTSLLYLEKKTEPLYAKYNHSIINGFNGLLSSILTDITTNPIRILKTYRQTNMYNYGYIDSIKSIVKEKGLFNFLTRGLGSRLIIHGIQSSLFLITWKKIEKMF